MLGYIVFGYIVLFLGGIILLSIIIMPDMNTKKEKRFMRRLLVASSTALFVACVLGSYFETPSPKDLLKSKRVYKEVVWK